jgi:hypothetical protein
LDGVSHARLDALLAILARVMPDADVEDARIDDADHDSRRRPRASLETRARAVFARFDWARDPALFLAVTLACVFSVALVVAAVTAGGAREGASGGRAHVLGRHGRASTGTFGRRREGWRRGGSDGDATPKTRDADATSRWAALRVPSACLASEFTPTAVIPGLELHELDGETAFYLSKEATAPTLERTESEAEEERAVEEELKEAKTEMKEAEKTLESEIATEEEELKIVEGKNPLPNVSGRRRRLLDDDDEDDDDEKEDKKEDEKEREGKKRDPNAPTHVYTNKNGNVVRRYRFQNPLFIDGMTSATDWRRETTEKQMVFHAANITGYAARCQFKTMQCADMATDLLARALKADANAVMNPKVSAETLKALSNTLIKYSTDPRTKYNASKLPSLGGAPQAMGTCAWTTEAEYNPNTGQRYDQTVSRFATAIDAHDTAVYCNVLSEKKYCKFTKIRNGPETSITVDFDEQAYESARRVGGLIHDVLSADAQLGSNVVGWGHRGEPSPAFVALLVLLRSNRCSRVDVYGQPGVPINWYHNARGYAHMVAVPGASSEDRELSRVLLQEKYFYRTMMHHGKMCFFK